MNYKITKISDEQVNSFKAICSSFGSLATLVIPGSYPAELKNCGVNERGTLCNQLLGHTVTIPSGSQLAIETSFFDIKDKQDNNDLHVINLESKTIVSCYGGWGTWAQHYGDRHRECKDYLRAGKHNQ